MVQKLQNNKQAHDLVEGFPMVRKVEHFNLLLLLFFFGVNGDEHFWDEKGAGGGGWVFYPIIGRMDKIK